MKLKRLIAIAVVLTTLLSCSCIAGSTVYAAEGATLYHWDGMLKNAAKKDADVGVRYGRILTGYTINGDIADTTLKKHVVGIYTPDYKMAFGLRSEAYSNNNPGTFATLQDSDDDYYYEISNPALRVEPAITLGTGNYDSYNLRDDVYSLSFDFRLPTASATTDRTIWQHTDRSTTDAKASNYDVVEFEVTYDAEQEALVFAIGSTDKTHKKADWSATTYVIEPDEWYNIEYRCTLNADDKFVVGVYVENKQISYYLFDDANLSFSSGELYTYRYFISRKVSGAQLDADTAAHYDNIWIRVLGDKENMAPSADEPSDDNTGGDNTGDDNTGDDNTGEDKVVYVHEVDGNKVTVTADIEGYNGVTGNAVKVIALFNASGRVSKLVSSPFEFPAVSAEPRQVTVELEDKDVATATKVKVFFFNSLTSAVPLLPSFSGLIN